ncbi:MAG TPA: helix-turn-helix transcriptional regulator [Gemmatales bacterium]|nr:helix-turn-helix transcriptional regulator [Gemmatales bacterium]
MKQRPMGNSSGITAKERKKEDLVFKALANRDRRAMLDLVQEQPRMTTEFCDHLSDLDRCTVMLHLRVLEEAELLITKRQGRCKLHYLNVVPVQHVYERWIKAYAQPAATLLTRIAEQFDNEPHRT